MDEDGHFRLPQKDQAQQALSRMNGVKSEDDTLNGNGAVMSEVGVGRENENEEQASLCGNLG